jgi:hypothetical protein
MTTTSILEVPTEVHTRGAGAAGLTDFRVFLCQVWDFLGLPTPTKVQLDIAWYLQHGPRRKIVEAFRGVGKSYITVAFVLWTLLLNPQAKILVVSAGEQLPGTSPSSA